MRSGWISQLSKERKRRYLWMRVSDDKYELPEIIADTVEELAEKCGVHIGTIARCVHNYQIGKNKHSIYMRIKVED